MIVFGIDPGPTLSGWVLFDGARVLDGGVADNCDLLRWVQAGQGAELLAIEWMDGMGMAVGATTFAALRWVGRFQQAWRAPDEVMLVTRRTVKLHVLGRSNLKGSDPLIRQSLISAIGEPGTKRKPGPTFGLTSHAWSALAVAVTALSQRNPAAIKALPTALEQHAECGQRQLAQEAP